MANRSTFIKLDRNIQKWRWYTNANTFRVFVHLLLNANVEDRDFEGIVIRRGEIATSYGKMAAQLKLTERQVRTAIEHLKATGEVAVTRHSKFQVISVLNYSTYQDVSAGKKSIKSQSSVNQKSIRCQQLKNNKEYIKNDKEYIYARAREGDPGFECSGGSEGESEKQYDEQGRELNSAGLPIIDFGLSKSGVSF